MNIFSLIAIFKFIELLCKSWRQHFNKYSKIWASENRMTFVCYMKYICLFIWSFSMRTYQHISSQRVFLSWQNRKNTLFTACAVWVCDAQDCVWTWRYSRTDCKVEICPPNGLLQCASLCQSHFLPFHTPCNQKNISK